MATCEFVTDLIGTHEHVGVAKLPGTHEHVGVGKLPMLK